MATVKACGLLVDIDQSTQYATVYFEKDLDGPVAGTISRRRVISSDPFEWSIYFSDGTEVYKANTVNFLLRRLAAHIAEDSSMRTAP